VIDRIAYSPYGEATRTLRSDVNGDGFVNQSDHTGIIRPRNGATIGTASYVVEADLDRNGVINQLDYDICIADDGKSSSGGVGEAGLFSRGVRNSVGYCGYIYNEDSGLYTVRFRTYSPTLGRWLERDPAGYVDGMDLYEYVRGGAIDAVDPSGLSTATGDRWWLDPNQSESKRRYEPRNDPANGCGITVRRAGAPGIKNIGHDWIEIDDPALNPVNGTAGLQGIGFWPKDKEGLFNAPSELYSPAAPSTNECTCKRQNDPYTGTVPAQIWPVRMAAKTHLKPRGGGIYEFWLTPAELPSGVPVTGANCEEIRDCVRSATVNRRFTLPIY
jgi:RHS repeat-associated protein